MKTTETEWVCWNGHGKCNEMYPGPDCPYCEPKEVEVTVSTVEVIEEFLSDIDDYIDFFVTWGDDLAWHQFSEQNAEWVMRRAEKMVGEYGRDETQGYWHEQYLNEHMARVKAERELEDLREELKHEMWERDLMDD